jgi:UDP-N-acetylglucosamine--N-acetylmuramyl-(pentapeptide) pyrophosphoryl-undecaprenol N-acetylglucosamine transferase
VTSEPAHPDGARRGALRICLAASGGGHVRQLLDLEDVWSVHDHFFITEDTALGRTLKGEHRTYFIPHYAWGQARLGAPLRMAASAIASFFRTAAIMARERPDVVISTGAGAVFFAVVWGRLFGARIVVIESFARFEGPSLFGRLAAPWAHELIVQSPKLAAAYPHAKVFDPLRILEGKPPAKRDLLFATVGATLPFDRLVSSIAKLKTEGTITEKVIIQTGEGGARPKGVEAVETLPFSEVGQILREASIVVCHGGTGSIITALREGCHVVAMPREAKLGEHYDDHQTEITEAFAARGLILTARNEPELRAALQTARSRTRVMATTEPAALKAFLNGQLAELPSSRRDEPVQPRA